MNSYSSEQLHVNSFGAHIFLNVVPRDKHVLISDLFDRPLGLRPQNHLQRQAARKSEQFLLNPQTAKYAILYLKEVQGDILAEMPIPLDEERDPSKTSTNHTGLNRQVLHNAI